MELPEVEDKMLTIATCVSDRASWQDRLAKNHCETNKNNDEACDKTPFNLPHKSSSDRESGTPTPLTAAHHKAEEEADFGHVSDGQLAHGAQHGLVVLGSRVGHARQLGLQGLSGGQLTHLHDVTETHPLLFGCWE